MNPVVRVNRVNFCYEGRPVLKDATFEVHAGEFIGIIGPNGGGKTTLLRLIMGFLEPDSGTIDLFDGGINRHRDKIAYVPQNLRFDKEFPISVEELVLSGLLSRLPWYGRYTKEQKRRAREVIHQMGLSQFTGHPLGKLSGGQVQRALIARALVSRPRLLILDEPTANVDPQAEMEIFAFLQKLAGEMTILMVTHDLKASIDKVDRVVCVQTEVTTFKAKEVCEHFALGLYHAPLLAEQGAKSESCLFQVKKDGVEQ